MTFIFNRFEQKQLRRELRADMPRAESKLWSRLRRKQIADAKFRRQAGVGNYVLDFYCPTLKLAIEIDGDSHFGDGAEARDARRQAYVEQYGIWFLRFTNQDIIESLEHVLEKIEATIQSRRAELTPLPNPPLVKGREPASTISHQPVPQAP